MTPRNRYATVCTALLAAVISGAAVASAAVPGGSPAMAACGAPATEVAPSQARCHALLAADSAGHVATFAAPAGYGPADLRDAYKITGPGRAATTIAVVVAYHDARAEADLATYRKTFGLPACTAAGGCFRQVDQRGGMDFPPPNLGWNQEEAVDVDMASAMCPRCKILVVESDSASVADLAAAVDEAALLGAHVIDNSFGGADSGGYMGIDKHWNHPGVAITASAGDGAQFPATSEFVTAVGGTTLTRAANRRGWKETALGFGACSLFPKPAWQTDTLCQHRSIVDVAAVADSNTGVAVFGPVSDTVSAWFVVGGTSVAAAIIAGVYGVNGGVVKYGSNPYAHPADLFDIRQGGGCGLNCDAGPGWDPPTGMGTPRGAKAFGDKAGFTTR